MNIKCFAISALLIFPLQANSWDDEKDLKGTVPVTKATQEQGQESDDETSALEAALGLKLGKKVFFGTKIQEKKQIEAEAARQGYIKSTRSGAQIDKRMVFSTGSAELNASTKKRIAKLAKVYKMHSSEIRQIMIGGHTDTVGNNQSNTRLSTARANSVKKELISQGVPAWLISAKGYGEYHRLPNIPGNSALNRRVEYSVTIK